MGNTQSETKYPGYTLVSEDKQMILVKNEDGEQFVIKKFSVGQENVLNSFLQLSHPHIVHHEEVIRGHECVYLALEHCEGGDLAQKIKLKKQAAESFENEILDWTVKISIALKYLHDQQIQHKNLQPKSIFFTACGTVRLGEFGEINEWSSDGQTAETEVLSYVAPENLTGKPYDEKSEIWRLGCVVYELCMLKCAFTARSTVDIISKILTCSYEALPETFTEDLHQLVKDTLQINPENRPSVSEILTRPFIIKHLHKMSIQTIGELYKTLDVLRELADGLETFHFNATVSSLTGGVVGLAGGITSLVGIILAPFTLGASLLVTGVGISVAAAGGVTSGVSNMTNRVNQRTTRQRIKLIIKEFQEKITSTICCIQISNGFSDAQDGQSPQAPLGRGLGGISELVRLTKVASFKRVSARAAKVLDVLEATTEVLSEVLLEVVSELLSDLSIAVDVFFSVVLDSREIHKIRQDYALRESQRESESTSNQTTGSTENISEHKDATNLLSADTQQAEKLKSETMKFATKIKETTEELQAFLDALRDAIDPV